MNEFLTNLRAEAEQNPTVALAVVAGLIGSVAKLVKAHGDAAGSRAYAKDVSRRIKESKKKS